MRGGLATLLTQLEVCGLDNQRGKHVLGFMVGIVGGIPVHMLAQAWLAQSGPICTELLLHINNSSI